MNSRYKRYGESGKSLKLSNPLEFQELSAGDCNHKARFLQRLQKEIGSSQTFRDTLSKKKQKRDFEEKIRPLHTLYSEWESKLGSLILKQQDEAFGAERKNTRKLADPKTKGRLVKSKGVSGSDSLSGSVPDAVSKLNRRNPSSYKLHGAGLNARADPTITMKDVVLKSFANSNINDSSDSRDSSDSSDSSEHPRDRKNNRVPYTGRNNAPNRGKIANLENDERCSVCKEVTTDFAQEGELTIKQLQSFPHTGRVCDSCVLKQLASIQTSLTAVVAEVEKTTAAAASPVELTTAAAASQVDKAAVALVELIFNRSLPLTQSELDDVNKIFNGPDSWGVQLFGIPINRNHFRRLQPGVWLSDEVRQ
jgi:hypothetical protein